MKRMLFPLTPVSGSPKTGPFGVGVSRRAPRRFALSSAAVLGLDSQDDSQHRKRQRTPATARGSTQAGFDSLRTSANAAGCQALGLQNRREWGSRRLPCKRRSYSNAGSKPCHLAALGGIQRIRTAISDRAAAIC